MLEQVVILMGVAFFAGAVDALGGGGGLIQVPALFSTLSHTTPATLLGTNKLASVWGSGTAAWSLQRRVRLEWNTVWPATAAAMAFSFLWAYSVTWLPGESIRKLLPFILVGLLIYTWRSSHLGLAHVPVHKGGRERWFAFVVGAAFGFYDGFFGPGTGSFLIFLFVRFFGFDFLRAFAAAKIVNVACSLAALIWFGYSGHVLWQLGVIMALCNVAGSLLRSRLALRHGSKLVRQAFLAVVGALILKSAYDAFIG